MRLVSTGRRAGEVALVVLVTALQVLGPTTGAVRPDPGPGAATLGALLGLAQGLALLGRRRNPGATGLVVAAGLLLQVLLVRPVPPYAALVATWSAVRAAARPSLRLGVPSAVLAVLGVAAVRWPDANGWVPLAAAVTVVVGLAAALAEAQAARVAALADRAASLERERDSAVARAAVEERLRIARDLHDLVGHGLTGIAVQSSTARLAVEDGELDRATVALRAVERSARDALAEVRQLLGVLRSDQDAAPARGLADLPTLAAQALDRGMPVRLDLRAAPVPAALGLTVYRVVQEALTNAARHAPGARVDVAVVDEPEGVRVRVEDSGAPGALPAQGTGHGLVGMRERVQAAGGTVETGPRPGGGWRVDVRLPREQRP